MASGVKYYKALSTDRACFHGGIGKWEPEGVPMPIIEGELVACEKGYHVCTLEQLIAWLAPAIWEVKVKRRGMVDAGDKIVVRQATLTRRTAWDMGRMVEFAIDCSEHVQHLAGPEVAALNAVMRRYVAGTATKAELDAASDASYASYAASDASYASYAARYAASAASYASYAASDAERAWQVQRLHHYLYGSHSI